MQAKGGSNDGLVVVGNKEDFCGLLKDTKSDGKKYFGKGLRLQGGRNPLLDGQQKAS